MGSAVCFRDLSVHDLDPAGVGHFDFVYLGSLLLHLRELLNAWLGDPHVAVLARPTGQPA